MCKCEIEDSRLHDPNSCNRFLVLGCIRYTRGIEDFTISITNSLRVVEVSTFSHRWNVTSPYSSNGIVESTLITYSMQSDIRNLIM